METLDEIIVRAALIDARKYLASGTPPAASAKMACVGAWAPYCSLVEDKLRAEQQGLLARYYNDDMAA